MGAKGRTRSWDRRGFLKVGTASLVGLSLAEVLRQEARGGTHRASAANSVILVWLGGGPATIDMWDLKPDAPDTIRGEFRPIATRAAGIRICEHLPKTAAVMDRCALVRSLQHGIPAHGPAAVHMATGHLPSPSVEYPSLGALAAKVLPGAPGVPPYVAFAAARGSGLPVGAGFLGLSCNPFEVDNAENGKSRVDGIALPSGFTLAELEDRSKLRDVFEQRFRSLDALDVPASLDRFQQQALDILRSDRTRRAFDLDQEKPALREDYGSSPFGRSVLAARRLIEAGCRIVTVGLGGWDTHADNFGTLRTRLLPTLDRALGTLVEDLDHRGLLQSTIVYCAGEFGRTPRVNGQAGRDHWSRSMTVFLAGGSIRRGHVHGKTDAYGDSPSTGNCSPGDVSATLFRALGVDPGRDLLMPSGRSAPMFRDGKVIDEILSR
jgi:hypothetical protein